MHHGIGESVPFFDGYEDSCLGMPLEYALEERNYEIAEPESKRKKKKKNRKKRGQQAEVAEQEVDDEEEDDKEDFVHNGKERAKKHEPDLEQQTEHKPAVANMDEKLAEAPGKKQGLLVLDKLVIFGRTPVERQRPHEVTNLRASDAGSAEPGCEKIAAVEGSPTAKQRGGEADVDASAHVTGVASAREDPPDSPGSSDAPGKFQEPLFGKSSISNAVAQAARASAAGADRDRPWSIAGALAKKSAASAAAPAARNPWLQWHYTQLQLPLSILNPQPQKRKLQRQRQPQLRVRGLQPHLRKLQLQALLPARRLEALHLKLHLPLLLPASNQQVLQRSVQLPLPVSRRKPRLQPQQHKPRPRPHLQPQQRKSPHPAMRPARNPQLWQGRAQPPPPPPAKKLQRQRRKLQLPEAPPARDPRAQPPLPA